ncbi:YCII-related domain protein [Candidatus Izimaplasma bacterium HR1]|jgi:uncharacterized protein YciI|uniref:YciI family protein n=1 Tax=Candidatus Izimoplasma sp. HR1 TaxID=1541959 RepID=UPI0004F66D20|nr:YCII-related domain protein [Candidatus Izimaplasma bacterium HR1]
MNYIYVLTLIERLISKDNWTAEDNDIVKEHFNNLVKLKKEGKLLLAGKTAGQDKDTMGIVIFKATSFEEANVLMINDPAIKKGIMTGKLWEYDIALLNSEYKND